MIAASNVRLRSSNTKFVVAFEVVFTALASIFWVGALSAKFDITFEAAALATASDSRGERFKYQDCHSV